MTGELMNKLIGVRKLIALTLCILAGLIGAIYMPESIFIAFASLLGTGLGIFTYGNLKEPTK